MDPVGRPADRRGLDSGTAQRRPGPCLVDVFEKCRVDERAEEQSEPSLASTVARIVRSSPAIRPGQRLCEAAAAMVEHGLPAVTVVNQSNRHLGVVTEDDILQVMYDAVA